MALEIAPGLMFGSLALGAAGVLWRWYEWRSLYHPGPPGTRTPESVGLAYEEIVFVAEDGCTLCGWWIPAERARGAVLHCPGRSGDMSKRVDLAAWFHAQGCDVFLFDYRGYGRSRGWPTERGTYRDARAAYEVIRAKYNDADDPPIVAHGVSLGGAIAVQLALDKPLRGLIVESTFTSIPELARVLHPRMPVRGLVHFRYDTLSKIHRISVPILIAHSKDDERVPWQMARRLYDRAVAPKQWVDMRGSHRETGILSNPAYAGAVSAFLRRVLGEAQ